MACFLFNKRRNTTQPFFANIKGNLIQSTLLYTFNGIEIDFLSKKVPDSY
jgi:hypothetical protein